MQLDFEGALKYFRVILPRKYRTEANAKELIHQAVKLKVYSLFLFNLLFVIKILGFR